METEHFFKMKQVKEEEWSKIASLEAEKNNLECKISLLESKGVDYENNMDLLKRESDAVPIDELKNRNLLDSKKLFDL